MRLVLLAFLDRRVVPVEILVGREPLHALFLEVAVRHRVTNRDDPLARVLQRLRDRPGRLALARAGRTAHTATTGTVAFSIVSFGPRSEKVAPAGEGLARLVHDVLVAHVGVREHDLVDLSVADQVGELALVVDRDAVRYRGPARLAG